jgi:hypothetical protein
MATLPGITRRAEEFKDLHKALQRNLQTYLPLTMDALAAVHQKVKVSHVADATRQMVRVNIQQVIVRLLTVEVIDIDITQEEVKITHDLCRDP